MSTVITDDYCIHAGSTYEWWLRYTATYNGASTNTWTIDSIFEVRKVAYNNATWCATRTKKIGIAGEKNTGTWTFDMRSVTSYYPASGSTQTIFTKTKTVACNEDGSISPVALYGYYDASGTTVGVIEGTYSLSLPTQARAATLLTFPEFNIGDEIRATVLNPGGFAMISTLKVGEVTIKTTIPYGGTNIIFALTEEEKNLLYQNCPENSVQVTLYVDTYDAEDVKIGDTDDMNTIAHVVNSNPIFLDFSYQDINDNTYALTNDRSIIVAGQSNIKTTISLANKATAQNYASMNGYLTTIGLKQASAPWSDSAAVEMTINAVENPIIYVTAIDSRGNQTTAPSKTATIINYRTPVITQASILRENDVDALTRISISGSIWSGNFGVAVNALKNNQITYRYKESVDGAVWSSQIPIDITLNPDGTFSLSNFAIAGDLGGSGFNIDKSFDFEITVEDELAVYIYTDLELPPGTTGIYGQKNDDATYSFGFGKIPTAGRSIDAAGPIYANDGEECLTSSSLNMLTFYPIGSVYMTSNADFDPNTAWGGTWSKIEGKMLIGADKTYKNGSTGGEATHTLSVAETPAHAHRFMGANGISWSANALNIEGSAYSSYPGVVKGVGYTSSGYIYLENTGGGSAHNNLPPYRAVIIWERTA